MSEAVPNQSQSGPDPVEQGAAYNPYLSSRPSDVDARITTHESRGRPEPRTSYVERRTSNYEVSPNPATISHPTPPPRPTDHGHAVGDRVVGSKQLFQLLAYGFELLKGLLVLVILAVLVHLFVATVFRISGESMLPNFADGQFILVDKLSYLVHPPVRGDVVVIKFPADPEHRKFIKRVIGLPGEKVEVKDGVYFIDDRQLQEPYLPEGLITTPDQVRVMRGDEYFVSGDNRPNSNDSRFFGPVPQDEFVGKSQAILSGKAFGWVAQPAF